MKRNKTYYLDPKLTEITLRYLIEEEKQMKTKVYEMNQSFLNNCDPLDENDYCEVICIDCGWKGQSTECVTWDGGRWPSMPSENAGCPNRRGLAECPNCRELVLTND